MIVALAFCAKDKHITVRLMQWLSELGWLDKHDCLLGVHADTDSRGVLDVAQRLFRRVKEFTIDDPETIYPFIANCMWKRCAYTIADINEASKESQPWFWLEPDAVPLVPEWLDVIEAEYKRAGKPFLFDKVVTPTSTHNSGTGVYPARVRDYTMKLWNLANDPWDVFFKDDFTPHTMHTSLIHDKFYAVWDDPKSGEPTFPDAASLAQIESGAVIFHRNKDGSLIARLRESRGNKVFRDANATMANPVDPSVGAGSNPSAPAFDDEKDLPNPASFEGLMARIELLVQQRVAAALSQRNGGDAPCPSLTTPAASSAAPTFKPKARRKKKRPASPRLLAALAKAREIKSKKKLTGVM